MSIFDKKEQIFLNYESSIRLKFLKTKTIHLSKLNTFVVFLIKKHPAQN